MIVGAPGKHLLLISERLHALPRSFHSHLFLLQCPSTFHSSLLLSFLPFSIPQINSHPFIFPLDLDSVSISPLLCHSQDKEVNLEQVHPRLSGLMEDDLVHKQLPGQSLEISALDMGSMRPQRRSQDAMRDFPPGGLSVTSFLQEGPGVGRVPGRSLPLPLSSSTLPPSMRCKHRAPNGGLFRQSPVKTPMPISYQAVPGGPIPEAIDSSHGTSIWAEQSERSKDCQPANHKNRVWTRSGCIYTITYIQTNRYGDLSFFQYRYIQLWVADFPCLYIFVYNARQQWSQSVFWIFMIFLKLSLKEVMTYNTDCLNGFVNFVLK